MKFWQFLILAALMGIFASEARSQNPVQIQPTTVDPTGQACNSTRMNEKTPDGKIYTCQNGTMAQIGGGGGGTITACGGATAGQVTIFSSPTAICGIVQSAFDAAAATALVRLGPPESSLPPILRGYVTKANLLITSTSLGSFDSTFGIESARPFGMYIAETNASGPAYGFEADVYGGTLNSPVSGGYVFFSLLDNISSVDMYGLVSFPDLSGTNSVANQIINYWAKAPVIGPGSSTPKQFAYYSDALGGVAANAFPLWFDEQGAFVVHSINTFDSVYQARPALYNPLVTKFTPTSTNFERCIPGCQWQTNVANYGTEAGGTGTLRDVQMIGNRWLYKTAVPGTNTTEVASTEFVHSAVSPTSYLFTAVPPTARYVASAQAALDGAAVSSWTDSSTHSNTATLGGGTPKMNRQTTNGVPAINFDGSSWFLMPSGVTSDHQAETVCVVEEMRGNTSGPYVMANLGPDSTDAYYLTQQGLTNYGGYVITHQGTNITGLGLHAAGPESLCFVLGASSLIAYRDDSSATGSAFGAGTGTGGEIGAYTAAGAFPFLGNIYELVIFPSALTSGQVQQWFEYSRATYGTRQFGQQFVQVCDVGDSITAGNNATLELNRPNQSFPTWRGGQFSWIEREQGLGGQTMQTVAGASVAAVTGCFSNAYAYNVLIIAFGYNDLYLNSRTAAQLEADLASYITAIRGAQIGWKILVATVTPGSGNAPAEAQRQLYNTWLKNTANPGGADGIVDITVDAQMDTYPASATFYSVPHPNNLGYGRLAKIFASSIQQIAYPGGMLTLSNCASAASPAVCGSASAGHVAFPTGVTSVALTVNTAAVTANSEIHLFADDSVGSLLSVTCNSTLATLAGGMAITSRTAGVSFTVTFNGTITANPLCAGYTITN